MALVRDSDTTGCTWSYRELGERGSSKVTKLMSKSSGFLLFLRILAGGMELLGCRVLWHELISQADFFSSYETWILRELEEDLIRWEPSDIHAAISLRQGSSTCLGRANTDRALRKLSTGQEK